MSTRLHIPGLSRAYQYAERARHRLGLILNDPTPPPQDTPSFIGDPLESSAPYETLFQNPHAAEIIRDFRWRDYLRLNPDLAFENEQQACEHFIFRGYNEQRFTDEERIHRLDPAFYRQQHPDLSLPSDRAAQVHYLYAGFYERRVANTVDDWVTGVTLHIFQPGKVGSHAIAASIDGKYPEGALHLHWPTDLPLYYPWCSMSYPEVVNLPRAQKLRVISGGRDIVWQVLSGAFQYLSTLECKSGEQVETDRVHAYLGEAFDNNCRIFENWFDHRFYCDLNIYDHPFDHQRGYTVISNTAVDLFLYRLENLQQLQTELGQFLQIDGFELKRANTADSKSYYGTYKELIDSYVVPLSTLKRIYSSRYMKYFFSEIERNQKIEFWSNPNRTCLQSP